MGENRAYTCQNPSCRKCFTTPLKAVNLRQNPKESYDACPYCLTKIMTLEKPLSPTIKKTEQLPSKVEEKELKEKQKSDKKPACNYHPGYLSERSSSQPIPDDCLVCKDIVDCMLKKMRE
jgi:hypothetical protein